jgi:heme oxygenase
MTGTVAAAAGAAARLRGETQEIHRRTENEPFVVDLLQGRSGVTAYASLAGQLLPVYRALEAAVERARPAAGPTLAELLDPRLERVAALEHDLRHLADGRADDLARPLPATEAYVARIGATTASWPRLVAHHYVRYLGDLSGGQVVAAMLRRHYGVPAEALTFFEFEGLGSKGAYKGRYRELLDELLADPAAYAAARDEALAAYRANGALFAALAATA